MTKLDFLLNLKIVYFDKVTLQILLGESNPQTTI